MQFQTTQPEETRDPMLGRVLAGQFEIRERIGSGGMGTVFKARHLAMGTGVALKLLHPALLTNVSLGRFQLEAKALAALQHPNIVKIMSMQIDSAECFIVMELLDGISLSQEITTNGAMPLARFKTVFDQASNALEYAHSKGFVHRDVKPSNIVLLKDGKGADVVKIVDFGLAKCLLESDQKLTQTGAVMGTPAFMSPEQILGNEIDPRTDIYSMGCVMFFAATGAPPFSGQTSAEFGYQQLAQPVPLISIPEFKQVAGVVQKATQKKPEARYATMAELNRALWRGERVCTNDKPIKIPNQNKQQILLVTLGATIILATALIGSIILSPSPRPMVHAKAAMPILSLLPEVNDGHGLDPSIRTRLEQAIASENAAREIRPPHIDIEEAAIYLKAGTPPDLEQADHYINEALEFHGDNTAIADFRAVLDELKRSKEMPTLAKLLHHGALANQERAKKIAARRPDADLMFCIYGKVAAQLGLMEDSQTAYKQVIENDKKRKLRQNDLWNQAMIGLADNDLRLGRDRDCALTIAKWRQNIDPDCPHMSLNVQARVHLLQGILAVRQAQVTKASEEFRLARSLSIESYQTEKEAMEDSQEIQFEAENWLAREANGPADPKQYQYKDPPVTVPSAVTIPAAVTVRSGKKQ